MKPGKLMLIVLKQVKKSFKIGSTERPHLQKLSTISELVGSKQFESSVSKLSQKQCSSQVTNMKAIIYLSKQYWRLLLTVVVLSGCGVMAMLIQPYLNDYLKSKIYDKFDGDLSAVVIQILAIYILYKLATSFLYIASDFSSMILGVKFYSTISHQLLTPNPNSTQITCLQDDSERLQNLPSSSTTSLTKSIQFITFSSILISKLPEQRSTVALSYWLFFTACICLAVSSSKLNLKILQSKQQRIRFEAVEETIMKQRSTQIKMIKQLMIVDGIGLILPWLLNVILMVVIYGIVGMPKQEKYFVLTIFGLLRASISGLGTNLNYFAQSWSSLQRISIYLSTSRHASLSDQLLVKKSQKSKMKNSPPRLQPTLSTLLNFCKQNTPFIIPILLFLTGLQFTSNFMYAYCAKSLITGESVFSTFNITALTLQLLSPILLYAFICHANQQLSDSVYRRLLANGISELERVGAEGINRLAGDIRLLDRQLYFAAYGSISHLTSIAASLFYSIVILNNTFSSILLILVICLTLWVSWLSYRFISLRKQSYRLQATNKGQLLQNLLSNTSPLKHWRNIYTYKCFGFCIEVTFISILYLLVIIVSCIIILVVMLSSAGVEESAILVMLISQLDYQFLVLFVQVVMMQTATAAVDRCLDVIRKVEQKLEIRQ